MTPESHRRPLARFPKDQPMHPIAPLAASKPFGSVSASRRRRRLAARVATVLAALAASTVGLGMASAPAMAENCPNAALREQNNSTQLPDCRAYELVTPVFKEGFAPFMEAITDDGRVGFISNGNISDNELGCASGTGCNSYVAARSSSGWSTTALAPSGALYNGNGNASVLTKDLRASLWQLSRADESVSLSDVYEKRPDGTLTRRGPLADPDKVPPAAPGGAQLTSVMGPQIGASDDLSHVIFSVKAPLAFPDIVRPDEVNNLYELVAGNETPRFVGVDNAGQQIGAHYPFPCMTFAGNVAHSAYHAMSTDGRVIFWVLNMCVPDQLFARINGSTTVAVSASQCTRGPGDPGGPCDTAPAPALFEGANAAGTRVYFTTSQQLVNGDTDSAQDLYVCDIPSGTLAPVGSANPCPDLREVSGAAGDADVQGVTRISDDGSRVYFVAKGVLASNAGANDEPAVAGADNLYVWQRDVAHPGGSTTFVGKLDPGDNLNLWGNEGSGARMAQSTDDGRYLLLATYAPLINNGPLADTDTSQDVYRYDAESGAMKRLSTSANGQGGNAPGQDATFTPASYKLVRPTDPVRPALSDDGGTVAFSTAEALSSTDTNGGFDTYMWRDGRVTLLSSGGPSIDDALAGRFEARVSPSGRDIYFMTTARLISNDGDTQTDIYDARVDGGFDLSPPPSCTADACQGERSSPPPASKPDSTSGQSVSPQTTPAFSVKAVTAAQRKRVASTGKLALSVTTNAPGTLMARATATIAKRSSTVGSVKRKVTKAGTVALSLTLSKKARSALKIKGKLTVKVLVSLDNVAIARTVSLKLTRAKAAKKKETSRPAVSKGSRS